MDANEQELSHNIKMKFGTAPNEPNKKQLKKIKNDINDLVLNSIEPTASDWGNIVKKHCPDAGKYGYRGQDTSDLITLLKLATKKKEN